MRGIVERYFVDFNCLMREEMDWGDSSYMLITMSNFEGGM